MHLQTLAAEGTAQEIGLLIPSKVEQRSCPKSLAGARSEDRKSTHKIIFASIRSLIPSGSTCGGLLRHLFGQFQKVNSAKLVESVPRETVLF